MKFSISSQRQSLFNFTGNAASPRLFAMSIIPVSFATIPSRSWSITAAIRASRAWPYMSLASLYRASLFVGWTMGHVTAITLSARRNSLDIRCRRFLQRVHLKYLRSPPPAVMARTSL